MSKILKITLIAAAIFSLSSCAAYNSIMPDWAKGSESAEIQGEGNDKTDAGDNAKWWNPITWFQLVFAEDCASVMRLIRIDFAALGRSLFITFPKL